VELADSAGGELGSREVVFGGMVGVWCWREGVGEERRVRWDWGNSCGDFGIGVGRGGDYG